LCIWLVFYSLLYLPKFRNSSSDPFSRVQQNRSPTNWTMQMYRNVGKQASSVKTQKLENVVLPAWDTRNLANPHSQILLTKTDLNVMVTSHRWPFISGFRTEMPYTIPVPIFSLTYAMGDIISTSCVSQYIVYMSGRVWAVVSLLAGILEKPGFILDGDMEYATCPPPRPPINQSTQIPGITSTGPRWLPSTFFKILKSPY
jgi:hypothetical protein